MTDPLDQIERIEAVDIHPGDTRLVYINRPSFDDMSLLRMQMEEIWPDNRIVFASGIDRLEVQLPGGDSGDALGTVDAEEPGAQDPSQGEGADRQAP